MGEAQRYVFGSELLEEHHASLLRGAWDVTALPPPPPPKIAPKSPLPPKIAPPQASPIAKELRQRPRPPSSKAVESAGLELPPQLDGFVATQAPMLANLAIGAPGGGVYFHRHDAVCLPGTAVAAARARRRGSAAELPALPCYAMPAPQVIQVLLHGSKRWWWYHLLRHKYHDRNSGLTEICLCFEVPILIVNLM
jgi:hypothetical protein